MLERIANMILRGIVQMAIDGGRGQRVQVSVLAGEAGTVPSLHPYGFTHHPRRKDANGQGAEALLLSIGGRTSERVAVVVFDRRYRLHGQALQEGDVALHTELCDADAAPAQALHRIQLTRDGAVPVIHLRVAQGGGVAEAILRGDGLATVRASTKILLDAPLVECTGDLIDSTDLGNANTVREMRSIYDGHVHPENDSGGPTDAPDQPQGPH